MRNPNRILKILEKVEKFWKKYPDLRLGQLLMIFSEGQDCFYMEDDILEEKLDQELHRK